VELIGGHTHLIELLLEITTAEGGIDEEGGATGLHQCRVTLTSAAKHIDDHDGASAVRLYQARDSSARSAAVSSTSRLFMTRSAMLKNFSSSNTSAPQLKGGTCFGGLGSITFAPAPI